MTRTPPEWIAKSDDARIPPRVCSVPGCGGKHDSHGFCMRHAHRFRRHGDPLGGTTDRYAAQEFMHKTIIPYAGDDCLAWPFGDNKKGYGVFHVARKAVAAHVFACEAVHGPKPTPLHEVAHSCGNGHLACCNPRHLRWATKAENHADKRKHGTVQRGVKNPSNKLTESDVRQIRFLLGMVPQRTIADMFGVSQTAVSRISLGKIWGWLS